MDPLVTKDNKELTVSTELTELTVSRVATVLTVSMVLRGNKVPQETL